MYNTNEECKKISARIRDLCARKGISYYELAKRAHLSTSTVYTFLDGKSSPQISTIYEICNALDIHMESLLWDDTPFHASDLSRVICAWNHLTEAKKDLAISMIEMLERWEG